MNSLTEAQKIVLNDIMNLLAHDDDLLEKISKQIGIDSSTLDELVNTVEF